MKPNRNAIERALVFVDEVQHTLRAEVLPDADAWTNIEIAHSALQDALNALESELKRYDAWNR